MMRLTKNQYRILDIICRETRNSGQMGDPASFGLFINHLHDFRTTYSLVNRGLIDIDWDNECGDDAWAYVTPEGIKVWEEMV